MKTASIAPPPSQSNSTVRQPHAAQPSDLVIFKYYACPTDF